MRAYRFEKRNYKKGIIKITIKEELIDKEVEIIILPKDDSKVMKSNISIDFIKKWAGFLSNSDEDSKLQYLRDKHG